MDAVRVVFAEMLSRGPEHFPFSAAPQWLTKAIESGHVALTTRGARDYAVMEVATPSGITEAGPGDYITHRDGELGVTKAAKS